VTADIKQVESGKLKMMVFLKLPFEKHMEYGSIICFFSFIGQMAI